MPLIINSEWRREPLAGLRRCGHLGKPGACRRQGCWPQVAGAQELALPASRPGSKWPKTLLVRTTWTGLAFGKEYELQTLCQEVAENTRTIRPLDWQRDRTDIEFALTNALMC